MARLLLVEDDELLGDGISKVLTRRGDEVFIPRRTRHRLSNKGTEQLRMLEVAYGEVRDDDKTRYEDKYGRV